MTRPAIGIDLGGSHASIAVVRDEKLLACQEVALDSAKPLRPALDVFAAAIHKLLAELQMNTSECEGVALGFCGLADARIGRVVSTNKKYEDAPSIDFNAWCKHELGMRFGIENDARMALLGERHAGAARGCDNVVMITLGTGIGGVAMIEGKLLRGKHAQAGCLGGHLPAKVGGRPCTCGAIGCVEAEASGWALPLMAREWKGFSASRLARHENINFQTLFELADAGDHVAAEIREYCLKVWATGAVGLIHAYDPERIVIGGGVMRSATVILPYIQAYVNKHAWTPWGKVQVVAAQLGNDAGLYGAIPLLTGNV
ncbi:MAG TPA: ROK family protein [Candidatus Acidoferrales bacterium]|nr:ROK family protein [Candidatus Acidoferrales bacterium]